VRFRLALSATFLGVLVAFSAWSVRWALDGLREVTFDMPGEVTTLQLYTWPQDVSAAQAGEAVRDLRSYLSEHALSLIVASPGDGYPQMIVFDPAGRLAWFSPVDTDNAESSSGVYLFAGTYSARRWTASSATPLLPGGATVAGVLAPPVDVGDLQYVRPLGADPLPSGTYVVSTTSSAELAELADLLARQGLEIQQSQQMPLLPYLTHQPLLSATAMFVLLGHVCAAMYWSVLLRGRNREMVIRRHHGARSATLVRRWFAGGLPAVAAGVALGVAVSGLVVRVVGCETLTSPEYPTLLEGAVIGFALTSAVWLATLFSVVRSRSEVSGAA
jgi:hypothetical protein